ncbi:hypothetical protein AAYQ05_16960 [Flavobacterium sp. B11]|uniref:hypothetical protein n=1 Tax=Flavobacterium movens TaxID=214860 RepID=UPI0031CFF640
MNYNPNYNAAYQFEIDPKIKETYRNADQIFGSNPETIKKISKRLLIFGIIIMLISIKAVLSLLWLHITPLTFIATLGAFLIYTSVYLRKNISKFPILIVYQDEILFRKQKHFGRLKTIDIYNFYKNPAEFEALDKTDLKEAVIPTGIFNTGDLYVETKKGEKIFLLLNVEKEYRDYIASYLQRYINN